jgi:site-specific recombinase XerD
MKSTKTADFAYLLSKFLSVYLAGQRNFSEHTILSYRDTFKLLLEFLRDEKKLSPDKLVLTDFSKQIILDFVEWLKTVRGSSVATCNQRMGAIHSFFEFVQYEHPEKAGLCQDILGVKMFRTPQAVVSYLSIDAVQAILSQPNMSTRSGVRDATLLSLLYDTGARVQELVDLTIGDVRFVSPATARLVGKGHKARIVPLLHGIESLLREYLKTLPQMPVVDNTRPLFCNRDGEKFTRGGIAYTLRKYADIARKDNPTLIPEKISPHIFRHSKAMHLLQADVNLIYIRDLLGHTNVKTTEVYARADSTAKRKALEKANPLKDTAQFPSWTEDDGLMNWLQNFGK